MLLVTGLPATGKTTLARRLAADLRWPLLTKDDVKEALFDSLGTGDGEHSRRLSDASFAALFRAAAEWRRAGVSGILEGNFIAGVHERAIVAAGAPRVVQVLCTLPASERERRLRERATLGARHPGHRDGVAGAPLRGGTDWLALPGPRVPYEGSRDDDSRYARLRAALDPVLAGD